MEQTWRWWGPGDLITLSDICQVGATGIVTALHDVPTGAVWTREAIAERRRVIKADPSLGLRWSVVESVPVHESIKLGEDAAKPYYEAYRETLRNLGEAGIGTVCYNFMPVLDWARTTLRHPLPGGATALRFNAHEFAAFDVHMLARPGAEADYAPDVLARARAWFDAATGEDRRTLLGSIMAGLPGAFDRYDIEGLRGMLARYRGVGHAQLQANLARFLAEVVPTAERAGVRLAIHPDDPPRPLLGLPRIASTAEDIAFHPGCRRRPRPPTASRCAPARSARARPTTCRPSPGALPGASTSCTSATSARSLTGPSWRPTTSAAAPTWWPWCARCWRSRSAGGTAATRAGDCPSARTMGTRCWTTWASRPTPAIP